MSPPQRIVCVACVFAAMVLGVVGSEAWRVALQANAPAEHINAFASFVEKFAKKYDTAEMLNRFQLFSEVLTEIQTHNAEFAAGKVSYSLGLNKYSDATAAERAQMRGLNSAEVAAKLQARRAAAPAVQSSSLALHAANDSLDWRTANAVNAIKDQGRCGSCWSFSATATLEGTYALQTGTLVSFSEQFCIDCANNGQDTCQTGGLMTHCYDAVAANGGEQTEANYPYKYKDTSSSSKGVCKFDKSKVIAAGAFGQYTEIAQGDENALFTAVGIVPTAIAIDASTSKFNAYSGGIYEDTGCNKNNLDHGVDLVGYGYDSASKKNYFILRNSWGTSWGENGYMRIVRGKNMCGIAEMASYIKPSTPTPPPPKPSSTAPAPPKPSSTAPAPPKPSSTAPAPPKPSSTAPAPPKPSSTAPAPPPTPSSTAAPPPAGCAAYTDCDSCTTNSCYYCGGKSKAGHCATSAQAKKYSCSSFLGWLAPTDNAYCPFA